MGVGEEGGKGEKTVAARLRSELAPEENDADGDESEGNVLHDVVHDGEELRGRGFDGFGGGFEFGEIVLGANRGDFGLTGAGNHKGTGDEFVAGVFRDVVLFAGDEGFVDLDFASADHGVDQDLVAEREDHEVTLDDLVSGDLTGLAVTDDRGLLLGQETHFVDGAFGANFVDDADQSVGDGDEDEEKVFVGANQDDKDGQDEVDEVEEGEGGF